jgi:hypothetical protein
VDGCRNKLEETGVFAGEQQEMVGMPEISILDATGKNRL